MIEHWAATGCEPSCELKNPLLLALIEHDIESVFSLAIVFFTRDKRIEQLMLPACIQQCIKLIEVAAQSTGQWMRRLF